MFRHFKQLILIGFFAIFTSHASALFIQIAALIVPNISYSETAPIQIESAKLHSIEISYSINTGRPNFCYLAPFTENESVISRPPVSYRILSDSRVDEVNFLAEYFQYTLLSEQEKLFVFSFPNSPKITGELVLYDEGSIPSEKEFTMELVVRGFECDAISPTDSENGFSVDDIDMQTSAPISVAEDRLIAIYSDEFRIDFNGR